LQNKVERSEELALPPPLGGVTPARNEVREIGVAPRDRLDYIDGLRACAALAVVFDHTALMVPGWQYINTGQHVPLEWLRHILVDGAHGVDLFFVLSGFCLAYPTLARFHTTGSRAFNVQRFAVHRLVRILPPYYIATALLLLGACIEFLRTGRLNTPNSPPLHLADIAGQFLMLDRGISLASSPYWTLLVEFRWYFLFPAVLFVFMRARNGFLTIIILSYIAFFFTRMHNLDFGLLPAFMLGILAANLMVTKSRLCRIALPLCAAAVVLAFLFEPYTTMPNNFDYEEQKFFWQTNPGWHFAAFFFVLAAGQVEWLRSLLSVRWLAFLGTASYSIYLVHYAVVVYVGTRLMERNIPMGYGLTVLCAVAIGVAFYFAVEQWFCGGIVREKLYAWLTPKVRVAADWLRAGT
jgi:peptidoglycan/LPS O-acetylase OafA/YrhL